MPAVYTSFWDSYNLQSTASGAITESVTWIPKGVNPKVAGDVYEILARYDLATGPINTSNTPLFICSLPAGTYDIEIVLNPNGVDLDANSNFTFNLGTVANPTLFASASTGLQATTPVTIQPTRVTVGAGESLRLVTVANELDSTGILYVRVRITQPAA